jgi:hypothetical protein
MEHFFPRDKITITTSMVVEDQPASNDNKFNASPGNTKKLLANQTYQH